MARKQLHISNILYLILLIMVSVAWVWEFSFKVPTRIKIEQVKKDSEYFEGISACLARALPDKEKIAYWQWDGVSEEVLWSDDLYEIYGYDKNTISTYSSWLNCIHPDDREYADNICQSAVEKKESYSMGYRIIDSKGKERKIIEHAAWAGNVMVGICVLTEDEEKFQKFFKKDPFSLPQEVLPEFLTSQAMRLR